jgi:hypothetical protein
MGFFGGGGAAPANMGGATSSAAGTAGLVPAPAAGKEAEYLRGDATFQPATSEYVPTTKKVKSGEINFYDLNNNYGARTLANNFLYWGAVYIPKTKAYSTVGLRVTTGASSTKIKVGIYSINTSGDPDALQFETGEIDSASTGVKTISITATIISAGWYYSATRPNGAPAVAGAFGLVARMFRGFGNSAANTMINYSTTTYANALPNPWSGSLIEGQDFYPIIDVY